MIHKVFNISIATTVLAIAGQTNLIDNSIANQYYHLDSLSLSNGKIMDIVTINGPETPPLMVKRPVISNLSTNNESTNSSDSNVESTSESSSSILLEAPAFSWSFGCSATSGAMIAGYYDRHGYPYAYAGPTNEGKMPLDNSSWPDWTDDGGDTRHQTPLSATHDGLDGRVGRGHVDDYWIEYGNDDDDPFEANGWTEHTYGDCTADFMKTNQTSKYKNSDGATTFYFYNNGDALTAKDMEDYNISSKDGAYGLKLFFESRGYTITTLYNQKIDAVEEGGFSFVQYKAEIDAGYPVMIHLKGHTIVGVGYDDTNNTVYLHDTWDYDTHSMTWGDSYAGMEQEAVSIVHLAPNIVKNDFNKDGIPDILFRDQDSGKNLIFFLYQTGVRESYAYTTKLSSDWDAVGLGDFNADGITDILFRNKNNGKNLIFFQKADGSRASYAYTTRLSSDWDVAGVADFNKDNIADILFRNKNNGKNLIFFQNADGSRASYVYTTKVSTSWDIAGVADFNNDGVTDIFYRNKTNGKNFISFQKADGSRASYAYTTRLSSDWDVAGLADFNKDGVIDILYRNHDTGKNLIFFQNTDGSRASYAYTTSISNSWEVVGVADFNGDKIADILFRNTDNGKNLIFFQNADGSRASYKYTTKLSTKWTVIK